MKNRVWQKYAVCFITIAVIVILLINLVGYQYCRGRVAEERKETLYQECLLISEQYIEEYRNAGLTLEMFMVQMRAVGVMLDADVYVIDGDGTILATTAEGSEIIGRNLNTEAPDFLNMTWQENVIIENVMPEAQLCTLSPILSGSSVLGYIALSIPMESVQNEVQAVMRSINLLGLIFLVVLLVVLFSFAWYHTKTLSKLNKAALAYSDGDFSHEIRLVARDEYRDLANTIRILAEQHANLVEYQKNFIANISHDFRSPLTSIKGYAEAMKDGTIPYEIQGKYLNIILFETDRLSNLTNDLLDLSNFENKGVRLIYSKFDITKMLKQSAMTFEGKCSQKNLKIRLVFPENDILVYADKGKIQQVIHNLVDNAIKFSHPDGAITITVVEKKEKILVSVKDSGIGIPKESISKVWERFYKTDLSRGKDKRGTGLGLSITKQIITAHNENIKVTSTEGVGTEFVFSLARAEQ